MPDSNSSEPLSKDDVGPVDSTDMNRKLDDLRDRMAAGIPPAMEPEPQLNRHEIEDLVRDTVYKLMGKPLPENVECDLCGKTLEVGQKMFCGPWNTNVCEDHLEFSVGEIVRQLKEKGFDQ